MAQLTYIRAKRDLQTVFLYFEPTETVAQISTKLAGILNTTKELRLVSSVDGQHIVPSKTATEANLQNDAVVYFVFQEGDVFEEVKKAPTPEF